MSFKRITLFGLFLFVVNFALYSQKDNKGEYAIHSLKESSFILPSFNKEKTTKEDSPIYFEVENKKLQTGRIILNLSTLGQESIKLTWKSYSLKSSKATWSVVLQYRLSTKGEWKDVLDENNKPYTFTTRRRATTKEFSDVRLPQDCENKEHIQLSWRIYKIKGKGVNPAVQIKNIMVESKNDPYNGIASNIFVEMSKNGKTLSINELFFNHIPIPSIYQIGRAHV